MSIFSFLFFFFFCPHIQYSNISITIFNFSWSAIRSRLFPFHSNHRSPSLSFFILLTLLHRLSYFLPSAQPFYLFPPFLQTNYSSTSNYFLSCQAFPLLQNLESPWIYPRAPAVGKYGGHALTFHRQPDRLPSMHCGTWGWLCKLVPRREWMEDGELFVQFRCK